MKLLVLCLGIALLVSGCTSGKGSAVNTSSAVASSSPVVSPSVSVATTGPNVQPGAKPPVMLEAAKVHDRNGAEVFVGYVIDAVDWAYSTTDSSVLSSVYATNCAPCSTQRDVIDRVHNEGNHFVGGHLRVLSATGREDPQHGAEAAVDLRVAVEKLSVEDASGRLVRGPYPGQTLTFRYYVSWMKDGWRVQFSTLVSDR